MKRIKLPDGSIGVFPADMSDDDIALVLSEQFPPPSEPGLSPDAQAFRLEGAQGKPGRLEEILGGAKHGVDRLAFGLKDMFTDLSPEDEAQLARGKAFVGETGWGSSAGQIGGEVLTTWPVGGAIGTVAGKVLPAAVKALGPVGGRVFNLGVAGRAASEGALVGAMPVPEEGDTRLGNAVKGGAAGAILPLAGAAGAGANAFRKSMSAAPEAASTRAAQAFERTLGPQNFENLGNRVRTATPTRLPQTTAALVDDMRLGALERGARGRELVDFTPHDTQVASQVWNSIQDDTNEAVRAGLLNKRPDKIMDASKAMFRSLPFDDADKNAVYAKMLPILDSDELRANPRLHRQIMQAAQAVLNPDVTSEILPQLYWSLKELGEGSTAASQLREVLKASADDISGGLFTRMHGAYGKAMTAAEHANSAKAVREAFMSPEGFPLTPQAFGGAATGGEVVPRIRTSPLNKALAKEAEKLDPQALSDLRQTADELRRHEIYRPISDTGGTNADLNSLRGAAVSLANVTPLWRAKGPLSVLYGRADKATQRAVDEALLNPSKFVDIVDAKRKMNQPLSVWEKTLVEMLTAQARAAGASIGE